MKRFYFLLTKNVVLLLTFTLISNGQLIVDTEEIDFAAAKKTVFGNYSMCSCGVYPYLTMFNVCPQVLIRFEQILVVKTASPKSEFYSFSYTDTTITVHNYEESKKGTFFVNGVYSYRYAGDDKLVLINNETNYRYYLDRK